MTPALLLVAAIPTIQPVPTVEVRDIGCGSVVVMVVDAPAHTQWNGLGAIGSQPPWESNGLRPITFRLEHLTPGQRVVWGVAPYGSATAAAEGVHYVAPCLNDAPVAVEIGDAKRIEARRGRVWRDVLKRWGAW